MMRHRPLRRGPLERLRQGRFCRFLKIELNSETLIFVCNIEGTYELGIFGESLNRKQALQETGSILKIHEGRGEKRKVSRFFAQYQYGTS